MKMNLDLTVLASTSIKRKKPWPKIAWLGKDQGGLYLLDKDRVSQLYLPSGKTLKKIPSVQPFLIDVQVLTTSSNGLYLSGALKSGKVFVWNRDQDLLHTTPVLDKIRNVLGSNNKPVSLYISNCGKKILLLSSLDQLFLWETDRDALPTAPGEPFTGTWVQIQSGEYLLPTDKDKESAIHGIFYDDQVCGQCAMVSWVFNKGDKMHITTIQLRWPQTAGNFGMEPIPKRTDGASNLDNDDKPKSIYNGASLSFTAKWHTFVHPLYGLTPAKRVLKSSKAYIARFSHDGQVLAIAMNQKIASDSRMMFYSTSSSSVAIVTDLKGCGSVRNGADVPTNGRLWWIADMCWTRDNLLLVAITRCGSLAILTKLGEPVLISTAECSVDMGPNFYLPLHPRISFRKPKTNEGSDSSMSSSSDADLLRQRFSVAVHPNVPVILTSDGYLVTVMQLPGNASYKGVILSLMSSIPRLVPEVEVDQAVAQLSYSTNRVNIFQSESNLSRVQSIEEMSENTLSSSSSLAGYGLASGDQGMAFLPILTPERYTVPQEHHDKAWKLVEAVNISLKVLALGTSVGPNWTNDISSVLYTVILGIVKLFSVLLRNHESLEGSLTSSLKMLSITSKGLKTNRQTLDTQPQRLIDCFDYFKMAIELFHWDSNNRNAFSLALRFIHGIIKEILGYKQFSDALKISTSMQFLEFSEDLLNTVYSWKLSSKSVVLKGSVDHFSPTKRLPTDVKSGKKFDQHETPSESDESEGFCKQRSQVAASLSAPWLVLYNYTAQSCKRSSKYRKENQDEVDSGGGGEAHDTLTQLLCDVQKKLQDIGVAIPSSGTAKADHVSSAASLIERNQDDTNTAAGLPLVNSPHDSLFGRKRANRGIQEPEQSTPTRLRKAGSLDYLLDASSFGRSPHQKQEVKTPNALSSNNSNDKTTETLLAILYVNLQQYNLKSALELVFSLMEPLLEHFDSSLSSLFAPVIHGFRASGGQDYATSQILNVLLQTFPILRVADKCGIPVVQSLGRFMAAYFSNLPLYIFPAYHPDVLPPFYMGEPSRQDSTSDESFALSQGVEVLHLDREKISSAARDQGISDIWSANNALEFMLVSGLIGEAAWLTSNLGDWKHALFLSVAHMKITKFFQPEKLPVTLLPSLPDDITPEKIVLVRLQPIFHSSQSSLPIIQKIGVEMSEDTTSTPKKDRLIIDEPNSGNLELEIDDKHVKDVGKMLQASVVAGLDIVPIVAWKMLNDLLDTVSKIEWIVPEELYLPAPPLFCPQPPSTEKEFLLPRVYRERQLRSEIAALVQKILTLFHSSNCVAPCIQWYVQELIIANEKWYNIPQDNPDFIMSQSLMNHSEMTSTFAAADQNLAKALKRNSPKSKEKPTPPRSSTTPSSSVGVVLACFQQFCFAMWMLHARDKMSLCARKYRRARNKAESNPQTTELIDGLCWETLQWTLELHPFSSFLDASSQVSDTLLTLLSEMQPSIATAEITARHFSDPNLIPSTSGRAKFKRLMTQFRGISLREAGSIDEDNSDEPLSVFYRTKCVEWEDELKERQRLYNKVHTEVFSRVHTEDELSSVKEKPAILYAIRKSLPSVGATIFETSHSYLGFIDTFFLITFTKTASQFNEQTNTTSVPLLLPYEKLFALSENKALRELQVKANIDKRTKISAETSLYRSQSYSDVRSTKPNSKQYLGRDVSLHGGQVDVRRTNSINDITKATSNSGIVVLGSDIIEMLPSLAWLSRWSSEGSFLPSSSNIEKAATTRANEGLPVMKLHVELPMLVNSLWLLKNIYGPWELKEDINPEFLRQVPKPVNHPSLVEQECVIHEKPLSSSSGFTAEWPPGTLLRRASSDTDIPRIMVQSPTTEEDSHGTRSGSRKSRSKQRLRLEVAAKNHSDTESEVVRPIQDQTHSKASRKSRKKSKSAKRALKLDANVQDVRDGGYRLESRQPSLEIKDMLEKNQKTDVQVKPEERPLFTNKTNTEKISFLSNKPRDIHPTEVSLPHHEGESPRLPRSPKESITDTVDPVNLPSPASKHEPAVKDESKDDFKDPQVIDRSDDVFLGNNTSKSVNNGGVELLLVLRPSNDSNQYHSATNKSHVPLLKLSTMTSNPTNTTPNENAVKFRTKITETASQTEPTSSSHVSTDTGNVHLTDHPQKEVLSKAVDFSAQYDESRDVSCQTALSPNPSHLIDHGLSEGMLNAPQMPLDFKNEQKNPSRFAWLERNDANDSNVPFPLLQFNEKPTSNNEACHKNVPPMQMFRGYPQSEDKPYFPLLHIPKQAASQQTNPRSFRLFQVPPEPRNLPLLYFPTKHDKKQTKPDLSKIKFLEVKKNSDPFTFLKMGETKPANGVKDVLLRMPVNQSRVPDFKSFPTDEAFKKETSMALLRMSEKKEKPKLVPAAELTAFEKKREREEEPFRYATMEKENIKPRKNENRRHETRREKEDRTEDDSRQTMSRQRRREHLHKKEETNDKVKPKKVLVQPAQTIKSSKTSKTERNADEVPAKSSKVILEEGLSEESELELSEISDNFNLSEEEELYFNIQSRPKVTNPQVDEYCRELEAKVRKQFDKELEQRMKEEMEREVKEEVKKQMEKKREEEEVRQRVREELALQERIEQQARARERELELKHVAQTNREIQLKDIKVSDRPIPRKRSLKHEKGTNVHFEDDVLKNHTKQNSVEVQVQGRDLHRTSLDQGNQTEYKGERNEDVPSDRPRSFAPVLPPDIFLGLTYSRDQGHDTDHGVDDRNVPEVNDGQTLQDIESLNRFISVADIDSKLWEKVQSSTMATRSYEKEEHHVEDDADEIDCDDSQQTDKRESYDGGSSKRLDKQPQQHDTLTVDMMDSIDVPTQRIHNARTVSKERISNRLVEMSQQLEAIEQITQNMDREFKSSNVLLNAIDSIGDIMTPPVKGSNDPSNHHASSRRYEKPPGRFRKVPRDNAPWRREKNAPVYRKEDTCSTGNDDDAGGGGDDDDVDGTDDEAELNQPDDSLTKEGKVSFKDETKEDNEDQISQQDMSMGSDTMKESGTEEIIDEMVDKTPIQKQSRDLEESRGSAESKQTITRERLSDIASSIASRHSNTDSFKDMPKLSTDALKEIFSDSHDSSKSNQRSLEKRKKIQDWMARKRTERHNVWKNEVDKLRSDEFKPFATARESPSSLKKIKLAEKERETKRRKREDVHTDERIKAASNLLTEMLAEPVPKADTLRNLRYAQPTSREKTKSKHNDRYSNTSKTDRLPSGAKKPHAVSRHDKVVLRDPALSIQRLDETSYTSSPVYPFMDLQYDEDKTNQYGFGHREETRSVTPSGADFITMQTYRTHEKDKLRRSKELERERLNRSQSAGYEQYRMDFTGLYRSGSSVDIDDLMDEIPDGSTMDEDRLQDIQSLLSDDSELKELLADVIGNNAKFDRKKGILKSDSKKDDVIWPVGKGTVTLKKGTNQEGRGINTGSSNRKPVKTRSAPRTGLSKNKPATSRQSTKPRSQTTSKTVMGRGRAGSHDNRVSNAPRAPRRSALSRDREKGVEKEAASKGGINSKDSKEPLVDIDDVSPWNNADKLNMSDDVAQLLAEAKQAIGDDFSESSGSIMSNIDWDAVEKIMNDL